MVVAPTKILIITQRKPQLRTIVLMHAPWLGIPHASVIMTEHQGELM
jgi:rRNA maturation protein Rpf1